MRLLKCLPLILFSMPVFSQAWTRLPGGDLITSTEYIGAGSGSLVPLRIMTLPRLSIDLFTEGRMRWQLLPIASLSPV
jgi:hypothetical protein